MQTKSARPESIIEIDGEKFTGDVQSWTHELDGSQTILIRTSVRDSVKDFLRSEIDTTHTVEAE